MAFVKHCFVTARTRHEAHQRSWPVLEQLSRDPGLMSLLIAKNLSTPEILQRTNYPVLGLELELNPHFQLVANCWIPPPEADMVGTATKTIHHHGKLLLSTVTVFGPGYEHWMFSKPEVADANQENYSMRLLEAAPHPVHHVSFVDRYIAHLPLYPATLSITICLWSNSVQTSWLDYVKRMSLIKHNEDRLRELAKRVGVARALDLNLIDYFDFYPVEGGFRGMRDRQEFSRGPCADHLHSLFHVLQSTKQSELGATLVERQLNTGAHFAERLLIEKLLADLRAGRPIAGKLSDCHLNLFHTRFNKLEIEQSLRAVA